jgi:hypothetical protein
MPPGESAASGPLSASLPSQGVDRGDSDEDEARRALRIERTMKALGYLAKLGLGAGALALDARGGSPAAAQMLAAGGGMVGNALIGASPTTQQARIAQARRGDEQRVQQGQEMDLRRLSQAAAERRQAMLDMQGAQRLDLEGRRVQALEEGLDVRRQATESLAADRSARAEAYQESVGSLSESRRADLDRRTQETSPESEMSRTAQAQIRDLRAANPRTVPLSDEQIDSLSWRDAQRWLNAGSTAAGRGRGGAGSGGGGGGSAGADALGPTRSFREFAAREYPELAGLSEAEREAAVAQAWSQLSGAERRAYTAGSAAADTREDDQRTAAANAIPGWSLRPDVPAPDTVKIRTAEALAASDTTMNRSLDTALSLVDSISTTERVGTALGFDSEQTARFGRAIDAAISEMTSYVNTGALNEADQARYERMFGSLSDLTSMATIRERLTAIKRELSAKARTRMESLGFQRGGGGGGGGQSVVRFRDPDGNEYRLSNPRAIERARAAGWEAL